MHFGNLETAALRPYGVATGNTLILRSLLLFFQFMQPKDKWDIPLKNIDAHEDDGKLKLTCEFWKPQVQGRWYKDKEELFIGKFVFSIKLLYPLMVFLDVGNRT